jgi:hypothetical protein
MGSFYLLLCEVDLFESFLVVPSSNPDVEAEDSDQGETLDPDSDSFIFGKPFKKGHHWMRIVHA